MSTSRTAAAVAAALVVLTGLAGPARAGGGCGTEVASTTISPSTVYGGDGAKQTVTLTRPARQPYEFVDLGSDDYDYNVLRTEIKVPGGQRSVTFPIVIGAGVQRQVDRSHTALLCSTVVHSNPVTVLPLDPAKLAVKSVTLPASAATGEVVTATLTLTAPARPHGTTARILPGGAYYSSQDLDLGAYGSVQTVPAGHTSVRFPVRVRGDGPPARISLGATLATSSTATSVLTVPDHLSVVALAGVSGASSFLVGLGRPAPPGGARVAVTVRHPDVHAPAHVTVPAGQRGAAFRLTVDPYPNPTSGTITVRWNGTTDTEPFSFY